MTLSAKNSALEFVISRVSRLYPAYWFAVMFTFIITSVYMTPGRSVSFLDAVVNLTMFQKWLGFPNVDGVYWTLSVEIAFYFIMVILLYFKLLNRMNIICILWLSFISIARYL